MKVTSALSVLPPLMEFIGGVAFAVRSVVRQPGDRAGRLTTGEFVGFIAALFMMYGPAKKLSRVNAEPAAGDRRGGAHLRDARHAQRGARAAGRDRRCRVSAT